MVGAHYDLRIHRPLQGGTAVAHPAHSSSSLAVCPEDQPVPLLPPDSHRGGAAMARPPLRPPASGDVPQSAGVAYRTVSRVRGNPEADRLGEGGVEGGLAIAPHCSAVAAPAEHRYPFPVVTLGSGRVPEAPRRAGGPAPRCTAGHPGGGGGRAAPAAERAPVVADAGPGRRPYSPRRRGGRVLLRPGAGGLRPSAEHGPPGPLRGGATEHRPAPGTHRGADRGS
jgi:hypothetical protein